MSKIYVGNLPFTTVDAELTELFGQFGPIKELALIKDRYTGNFKGFGFITYETQQAAEAALSMDGQNYGGRPMKVSIAREGEARTGGGGRRQGGFRDRKFGGDRGDRGGDRRY
ncbi:MAG: RNA-binding protein [Gammaproteobacteria bacterium]|jgi:RNA recognition motif-containing protein